MRIQTLRQYANLKIKLDRQGKYLYRKHRAYVIHKMIDDLFVIRQVPPCWQALRPEQLYKLVRYWEKQKVHPVTMMRYMTIIRRFLSMCDCSLDGMDNRSLELFRPQLMKKRKKIISADIWKTLDDPLAQVIMGFQCEFGLTFREAIVILDNVHVRKDSLWITNEVAFNSQPRTIPVCTVNQKAVIHLFHQLSEPVKHLIQSTSYEEIRLRWRKALAKPRLPSTKSWRFLYARQRYSALLPEHGKYKTCQLIRDEMGIQSRNTLWQYLKD